MPYVSRPWLGGVVAGVALGLVAAGAWRWHEPAPRAQPALVRPTPSATVAAAPLPQPGIPTELVVPGLQIDAPIMPAGLTASGEMQAPATASGLTWYEGGPRPGLSGNAVLAGHLELGGAIGVFWRLHELKVGDEVQVVDNQRIRRYFMVRSLEDFAPDHAPLGRIFGAASTSHLNLVTCDGVWQPSQNQFSQWLVVFTDLVATVRQ